MRRNKSNTMTFLSVPQLNNLITANAEIIKTDAQLPKEALIAWFAISTLPEYPTVNDVRQHDFNVLTAYTTMNKLLRKRGLVLKKKKDTFMVLGLNTAKEKSIEYLRVSDRNTLQRQELRAGIRRYQSSWSPLADEELSRIRD